MDRRAFGLGAAAAFAVAGCANASKFHHYSGPEVTSVVVNKGARRMYLLHHAQVLKDYRINLGFAPMGHKAYEGDGRTPEGTYLIDRRNPNSRYHLSVGISYPNTADVERARALGKRPGGQIFIHGEPRSREERQRERKQGDWTAGCIAVSNDEMEEIYAMVRDGTVISLRA